MTFEKNIREFENRFDARIKDSGYAYDSSNVDFYSHEDFSYTASMDAYHVKKVKTVSICMTENSLYNLLDYLEFCEQDRIRHLSTDSDYDGISTRQKYYDEIMREKYDEEKLRKQHPALQDAWEQYEAMKILITK
jgi:hypothetical protein